VDRGVVERPCPPVSLLRGSSHGMINIYITSWLSLYPFALVQLFAGSLAFFITRQQTCRRAFQEDMQYGGAQYIATGRGFSISSSSFLKCECAVSSALAPATRPTDAQTPVLPLLN